MLDSFSILISVHVRYLEYFTSLLTLFWNIFKTIISFIQLVSIRGWKQISTALVSPILPVWKCKTKIFCPLSLPRRSQLRSTKPLMALEIFWDTLSGISHRERVKFSKLIVCVPRREIIAVETDFSATLNESISCRIIGRLLRCNNL